MQLSETWLFQQPQPEAPAVLLQQLQDVAQQLQRHTAQLTARLSQEAVQQLQLQLSFARSDAQQLCSIVVKQRELTGGQDPLSLDTAARIDAAVCGLTSAAEEENAAWDDAPAADIDKLVASLSPAADASLRRIFAATDTLSQQQVRTGRGRGDVFACLQAMCVPGAHVS